jgi:molybdate transport system substrate-binding protein
MLRILLILLLVFTIGCAEQPPQPSAPAVTLTLFAAASLSDAIQEISAAYRTDHPNIRLEIHFASSGTLQRQIEQGAPADLFLSASDIQMQALRAKGLIDPAYQSPLLQNELVLITKADSPIRSFPDLTTDQVKRVAIGHPDTVPVGVYARDLLTGLNLWTPLQSKLLLAKDVREVLAYVETGNADAGFVYKTDALTSAKIQIRATAAPGQHIPIRYPLGILTATKHRQESIALYEYLRSPKAMTVFQKYGFLPIPAP